MGTLFGMANQAWLVRGGPGDVGSCIVLDGPSSASRHTMMVSCVNASKLTTGGLLFVIPGLQVAVSKVFAHFKWCLDVKPPQHVKSNICLC